MMVRDNPNKRNRMVRIDKPTETVTAGKATTTWALFGRAWVTIEPLSSREHWEANRQESSITHKITGTWEDFQNVKADFRLIFEGRTFHIDENPRNIDEANVLAMVMVEEATR